MPTPLLARVDIWTVSEGGLEPGGFALNLTTPSSLSAKLVPFCSVLNRSAVRCAPWGCTDIQLSSAIVSTGQQSSRFRATGYGRHPGRTYSHESW